MKEFSLSELNRRPGEIADAALAGPVVLRKHGRRHLVLLSADIYDTLTRGEAEAADAEETASASQPREAGSKLSALRLTTPDEN